MKGHIRRRGKKWAVVVSMGRDPETHKFRYRWFSGYRTRKAAEADLPNHLAQAQSGGLAARAPADMTLGEFLKQWLDEYAETNVRHRTLRGYRSIIGVQLIPRLGGLKLSRLQSHHLRSYYAEALKNGGQRADGTGLAARTVNHHHRVLSEALGHAVKWGLIQRNVAQGADPPRIPDKEMLTLTAEQLVVLLEAARQTEYDALLHVAAYTGLRRSELLGLRWKDILLARADLMVAQTLLFIRGQGFVFEEPKTKMSRRTVALPSSTVEELRAHQEAANPASPDSLVFSHPDGSPLELDKVSLDVIRLARRAGMPKGTGLHTLRHTHATLLLAARVSLKVVQERLGHATPETTARVYAHVLPHMQREAADEFGQVLERAVPKA